MSTINQRDNSKNWHNFFFTLKMLENFISPERPVGEG